MGKPGPKKIHRYSVEFKLTAVKLSHSGPRRRGVIPKDQEATQDNCPRARAAPVVRSGEIKVESSPGWAPAWSGRYGSLFLSCPAELLRGDWARRARSPSSPHDSGG